MEVLLTPNDKEEENKFGKNYQITITLGVFHQKNAMRQQVLVYKIFWFSIFFNSQISDLYNF